MVAVERLSGRVERPLVDAAREHPPARRKIRAAIRCLRVRLLTIRHVRGPDYWIPSQPADERRNRENNAATSVASILLPSLVKLILDELHEVGWSDHPRMRSPFKDPRYDRPDLSETPSWPTPWKGEVRAAARSGTPRSPLYVLDVGCIRRAEVSNAFFSNLCAALLVGL